ncbi:MAG: cell surface glycoprotein, partial [Corynebacterium variabile]|nr:cell surface glycoprotein [Corynebacterium variabile]
MSTEMNWSQKKDTAPGMPDVPLEVLALVATVPDPTEETVREILPEDQSDADATAGTLAGLFHGRKPPRPTPTPPPGPPPPPPPQPAARPAPHDPQT